MKVLENLVGHGLGRCVHLAIKCAHIGHILYMLPLLCREVVESVRVQVLTEQLDRGLPIGSGVYLGLVHVVDEAIHFLVALWHEMLSVYPRQMTVYAPV
jgi:hypothetical protein